MRETTEAGRCRRTPQTPQMGQRRRRGAVVGRAAGAVWLGAGVYFPITTPHGSSPTGMSLIFLRVAVSITLTLLERPLAT